MIVMMHQVVGNVLAVEVAEVIEQAVGGAQLVLAVGSLVDDLVKLSALTVAVASAFVAAAGIVDTVFVALLVHPLGSFDEIL